MKNLLFFLSIFPLNLSKQFLNKCQLFYCDILIEKLRHTALNKTKFLWSILQCFGESARFSPGFYCGICHYLYVVICFTVFRRRTHKVIAANCSYYAIKLVITSITFVTAGGDVPHWFSIYSEIKFIWLINWINFYLQINWNVRQLPYEIPPSELTRKMVNVSKLKKV